MDSPGRVGSAVLSLFRPRTASRLPDGTMSAPLLVNRPTAHLPSGAAVLERLPEETILPVMSLFETVYMPQVSTDQAAQIYACSILQLVKPVNAAAHDSYHRARERASCLKLRCGQLGSAMSDGPSDSATDYSHPTMAVSKELYEEFNRDPSSRMALIDFADALQHSPVQALRLATQQLIPLLAFNASSWFIITDLVLTMFPSIRGIRLLEPAMLHWKHIENFADRYKRNPRDLALARMRGAEGSQIFSRSGVEPLIAIGARVGARVARASWERVETSKKELLVDEDLIKQTVAECLALMDQNKTAILRNAAAEEDETQFED